MKKTFLFYFVFISGVLSACTQKTTETKPVESYPSLIEITGIEDIQWTEWERICSDPEIQAKAYQWKDHLVLYGDFQNRPEIQKQIAAAYPQATVKRYDKPFYVFDRRTCDNKEQSPTWSRTIMTAHLVADETLQQEYMNLHATQPEYWPEVADGFCNAGFQQLLVFRSGRQLMLVISIPEGENLDELNPKTIENNPRVEEWNALMTKYQEGIEGTEAGETWVVLSPLGEKMRLSNKSSVIAGLTRNPKISVKHKFRKALNNSY